eukprot:TRINITY_DN5702_c0_g1_i2.p1 TRINITY_DN5702_c0_g1~~TRINITY_DN5702_c0_g1_i2.p1  ORF type:complete len:765 (-),score=168.92 TRINITY_DN5702_c0_g1_i2:88-2382(-)
MGSYDEDEALNAAIAASLEEFEAKPNKKLKLSDEIMNVDDDDEDYNDDDIDIGEEEQVEDDDIPMEDDEEEAKPTQEEHDSDNEFLEMESEIDKSLSNKPYECISKEEIVERQTAVIKKACDIICMPFSIGRILLQFYNWDYEKLTTQWVEDAAKLCANAGVDINSADNPTAGKKVTGDCSICFETSDSIWMLSCGHGFCIDCWQEYLSMQIKENTQRIKCPGVKCSRVIDEYTVLQLTNSAEVKERFNQNLINSFVDQNPLVKWCPSPNCEYAIILKDFVLEHNESVRCKCSRYFCFRCGEEGHAPALCDMFKDWVVKNSGGDEALNQKFLAVISRPCPACKANIEKNGGCNHMTCQKCGYHFCWLCMGKFGTGEKGGRDGYSSHKCNTFEKPDEKIQDKEDWERFRWYSERFNNHSRSRRIENDLLKKIEPMINLIQEQCGLTFYAASFYEEILEQIVINRTVLMWSYVFGYFRPLRKPEINKELFEHRQNELERHTEILAKWIDNDLEEDKDKAAYLANNRFNIINDTKLSKSSYKALLDVAYNAFEPERLTSSGNLRFSYDEVEKPEKSKNKKDRASKLHRKPSKTSSNDRPAEPPPRQQQRRQTEEERRRQEEEEEEALRRAMQESLQAVEQDEDAILQRILRESLADTGVKKPAAPSRGVTEEEAELEEAIRQSLLQSQDGQESSTKTSLSRSSSNNTTTNTNTTKKKSGIFSRSTSNSSRTSSKESQTTTTTKKEGSKTSKTSTTTSVTNTKSTKRK